MDHPETCVYGLRSTCDGEPYPSNLLQEGLAMMRLVKRLLKRIFTFNIFI